MNERRFRALISGESTGIGAVLAREVLWWGSLLYGLVIRVRLFLYWLRILPRKRATVPVVCVGNLTTGGTGKTPMVALVARMLQDMGHRPGVLSRGYKSGASSTNDEAAVLAEMLPGVPHVQNPDRASGAAKLAGKGVSVIVMDDGFSHLRLRRDLDIVLVDATCPFGYEYLLPRGLLREPMSSLRRAGIVVITRSDQVTADRLAEICAEIARCGVAVDRILTAVHAPGRLVPVAASDRPPFNFMGEDTSALNGQRVALVCGIANPSAFRATVEKLGATVVDQEALEDHFAFPPAWCDGAWPALAARFKSAGAERVVVTQKDAVKIRGKLKSCGLDVWELGVGITIQGDGEAKLRGQLPVVPVAKK